jgi:tetratricopeptide (TPR) repeat protein
MKLAATAVMLTTIACADPGAITLPRQTGRANTAANGASCSPEQGQAFIEAGQYKHAIREFTCLADAAPTAAEGYRGRAEALLMLGRFSDALRDYTRLTAFVLPGHPEAEQEIIAGYKARLEQAPDDVTALTGLSFAYWYFFDYAAAIHVLERLVDVEPDDTYGNLFIGSSRFLRGRAAGATDLERAIELDPSSPDVHFIVADAYTYGAVVDPQRAFDEATTALEGGLDTPRIRAIRASSYLAFGDGAAAAREINIHLDLVTTELVVTSPLAAGSSTNLAVVPGRTYEIPITVAAGESVSILTSSKDFIDTILALLAPNGTPVVGSDDFKAYFAGFEWVAPAAGTYRLRVTSFESVSTGTLSVVRK